MKTIIITGPSGSGKSYLSKKLSKLLHHTILIKTDSYYKDSDYIKFLSILLNDIYDRPFSIKRKELLNNINLLNNKAEIINSYNYDFKRKKSFNKIISVNYDIEKQFLIIEGIFAHRLDIDYTNSLNIICKEDKHICLKRRLRRDQKNRGRSASCLDTFYRRA